MKREIKDLNSYLGDRFNTLIDYCKLRPCGYQLWRRWRDDWGFELIIKTRKDFEIKKLHQQQITDIYYLFDFKEIEKISVMKIKEGGYLGLLGKDGVLRVYHKEQRVSPLSIGINKLESIITEINQEKIEQQVASMVTDPIHLRPRKPLVASKKQILESVNSLGDKFDIFGDKLENTLNMLEVIEKKTEKKNNE